MNNYGITNCGNFRHSVLVGYKLSATFISPNYNNNKLNFTSNYTN